MNLWRSSPSTKSLISLLWGIPTLIESKAFTSLWSPTAHKGYLSISVLRIRGGSSSLPNNDGDTTSNTFSAFPDPNGSTDSVYYNTGFNAFPEERPEAFQDRIDRWKKERLEHDYSHQTQQQQASSLDEQGRRKLNVNVGRGARAIVLFVLVLRTMTHQQVADETFKDKGLLRVIIVHPLLLLTVGDIFSLFTTLLHPAGASKNKRRLKAIVNLNKVVELVLILFYMLRLTIFPTNHHPREVYVGNAIHSALFLLLAHSLTAGLWWDDVAIPLSGNQPSNQYSPPLPSSGDQQQGYAQESFHSDQPNYN